MRNWWFIPMLVAQIADSAITSLACPGWEWNLLLAYAWRQYGFMAIVAIKALGVLLIWLLCKRVHRAWREAAVRAFNVMMGVMMALTFAACMSNAYWLRGVY